MAEPTEAEELRVRIAHLKEVLDDPSPDGTGAQETLEWWLHASERRLAYVTKENRAEERDKAVAALTASLRAAITDGGDAGWGIDMEFMSDPGVPTGATVWHNKAGEPRALVLTWERAQELFRLLGLTDEGHSA